MILAAYALIVTLSAPLNPEDHLEWDKSIYPIPTLLECEALAYQQWRYYYAHYTDNCSKLETRCVAHEHGRTWLSKITCEREGSCYSQKGEM